MLTLLLVNLRSGQEDHQEDNRDATIQTLRLIPSGETVYFSTGASAPTFPKLTVDGVHIVSLA